MDPSFLVVGVFSKRQIHRWSRHSVSGVADSHCSLKKHVSFTLAATKCEKIKHNIIYKTFNKYSIVYRC